MGPVVQSVVSLTSSLRVISLTVLVQGGHALWKTGKTGKMVKKIPCREKSGNLKFCWKSGKNQGFSKNLIFVRSKYSNFIAVQMWLLVVSFCHMLKIPADLILLKGGVLVFCIFWQHLNQYMTSKSRGHCNNIKVFNQGKSNQIRGKSGKNQGIWLLKMCGHPVVDSIYNILIFFAEKMWVAFALLTFFQQKISAYLCINVNFNESLTNDIVSFEQLGHGILSTVNVLQFRTPKCLTKWHANSADLDQTTPQINVYTICHFTKYLSNRCIKNKI